MNGSLIPGVRPYVVMALAAVSSVSAANGVRVTVTPQCRSEFGPEVLIQLQNIGSEDLKISEGMLPWSGGIGNITFQSLEPGSEVEDWVSFVHGRVVVLEPGGSLSGTAPLWDRITPSGIEGRRSFRWEYGKLHRGTVSIDFSACPIEWRAQ